MHVIIAGAGLGGLTLALCLRQVGIQATVVEQARVLGEVGAGVQISANGARVLHRAGLAEPLARVAFKPERGEIRHWQTGEVLHSRPLGKASEERFGFPYYHLHRADLHSVLVEAVTRDQPEAVKLQWRVAGFDVRDDGVHVTSERGDTLHGDVLVGADGIHSRVRAILYGAEAPRFTGCIAWRATVPASALPAGHVRPVASNWLGPGGHFVHYYVRRGELVNCVGVFEGREWMAESWSSEGDVESFRAEYRDWHEDLRMLVDAATQCFRWGLFDRDPLPRWSDGPVTLLGDACHAMLPFQAQGAVMSIEDAFTLAACLDANDDPHRALERYETLRLERTATVQQMSRSNMSFFHDPDRADLEDKLKGHRDAHAWLYGHDVTAQPFVAS